MLFDAGCSMPVRTSVLAVATILFAGCARVGSDPVAVVCLPVVEYSKDFQLRAADEVAALPDGSAIVEMLEDYAVMRAQARACSGR
jgi:creatinine amidohydrolase/Fe(II)-dependent formamide hydrolase-like protein